MLQIKTCGGFLFRTPDAPLESAATMQRVIADPTKGTPGKTPLAVFA